MHLTPGNSRYQGEGRRGRKASAGDFSTIGRTTHVEGGKEGGGLQSKSAGLKRTHLTALSHQKDAKERETLQKKRDAGRYLGGKV